MNNQNNIPDKDHIDIIALFKTLWQKRKVFYWVWPITFVISAALILCVPRYYTCEVILAPESQSTGSSGSLQSLASSFGFDMRSMSGSDALYPLIYPDIVNSPDFIVKLFDIPVKTADGDFEGTNYQHLQDKRKTVFWKRWIGIIRKGIKLKRPALVADNIKNDNSVFFMREEQWDAIKATRDNITCVVDRKNQIITLSVTAKDPLVCAIMADSVCAALQNFVADYRTQKARMDLQYYEEVMNNAYREYQEASNRYIRYIDSHSGIQLERYRIEAQNLEREMQIKQAAYTSFQKQYLTTQARVQENIPVYTVIQSASVPLNATGPKRIRFVLIVLLLVTCMVSCFLCKELLVNMFK